MAESLRVDLGKRGYDILVGERLLAGAGEHIAPVIGGGRAIIVTDENVARLYLHRLTGSLDEAKIPHRTVIVKPGEATKSLSAFSDLLEQILEQKPDRKTMLVALGGGVVGDVTGFAASVLLRGIGFVQIPTTLLAQVDSAVGGKTGVNSRFGKNLIGSFHQPRLVLSDVSVLSTLPRRELLAGYAETLKYALIGDTAFFAWLEKNALSMLGNPHPNPLPERERGLSSPSPFQGAASAKATASHEHTRLAEAGRRREGRDEGQRWMRAILTGCKAKAAIVAEDEREAGKRALLNFGHTFAHALEAETGFSDALLHGEAVAIGMVLALKTSVVLGMCPPSDLERVLVHYRATGLPASPLAVRPAWDIDALMAHFAHDKKAKNGELTFILASGIGQAKIVDNVNKSVIRQVLAESLRGV